MRHFFPYTLEREDEAGNSVTYDISIEGTWRAGAPQTWTDPADPDEFEIDTIDGLPDHIDLTEAEYLAIEDWAYANPPEPDYPEYD